MPDNADLGRLIVRFDADLTRLEAKMGQAVRATQRTARQMEQAVSGVNLQRGLGNIISSGQSRVMEAATSRLGVMGGALEALGPAAMTAAAGIAVMAASIEQAMRAAEWAETLGDVADALHLTAEEVQALDFAATSAGVPVDQMRTSMQALNVAMGQAQAGGRMGRRMQEVFSALGIDPTTLRSMRDVTDLLPILADGLQRLAQTSPAEAAALGQRLGLTPEVLAVMEQGRARIEDLIGAAERYGLIIDESMVRQGAAAADQMRETSAIIDAELRAAFINLAPAITGAATALADAARAISEVIGTARAAIQPLIELARHLRLVSNERERDAQMRRRADWLNGETGFGPRAWVHHLAQAGRGMELHNDVMDLMANGLPPQPRAPADAILDRPPGPAPARPTLNSSPSARAARSRPGAARSSANANAAPADKAGPEIISAAPGSLVDGRDMRGFALPVDQSVTLITPDTYLQPLFEAEDRMRETYHNVIQGGLEAAIHGGWPGLAKYIAEQLQQQMVQRLADTLTNMFVNAVQAANGQISLSGGGGGGLVGTLFQLGALVISGGRAGASTVGSASHVHAHAFGTDFAPGGLTKVGEYGMEYVNLPRGSQVLNARASKALSRMGGLPAGGMMAMLHQTIHLHAEGAVLGNELMATLDARAVQYAGAAFNGARRVVPMDMGRRALRKL